MFDLYDEAWIRVNCQSKIEEETIEFEQLKNKKKKKKKRRQIFERFEQKARGKVVSNKLCVTSWKQEGWGHIKCSKSVSLGNRADGDQP